MSNKFPKIIHVTEERPDNGTPWLQVHKGGVAYIDEPQDVAVYQLVKVGRVAIDKRFVEKRSHR